MVMWKLLKYMKNYKKEAFLAPAFKLLEALLELFVPLVMAAIIDVGIKSSASKSMNAGAKKASFL